MTKIKNILILYFFAILIALFVSLPLLHNFLRERAVLAEERERLQREDARIENLRMTETELVPYAARLDNLKMAIPSDPSIPSLVRHLETLIADSGIKLVSIGPFSTTEMAERPHLRETKVEIKVSSDSYPFLKGFLEALEKSIKIIIIESASISPIAEEEEVEFVLTLSLKTYSY